MTSTHILDSQRSWGRRAGLAGLALALAVLFSLGGPNRAGAFVFVVPAPSFPTTTTVGDNFPASMGVGNFSTPPESVTFPVLQFTNINLVPACDIAALDCAGGIEPGVFSLSPTGIGTAGPASCLGTWTITEITPGTFRFTPPGGEGSLLLGTGEVCVIDYSVTTLRVPSTDVNPAPGVQTIQLASATAQDPGGVLAPVRNSGSDITTIFQAQAGVTTLAAQSGPTIPGTTSDTATLTAPSPPAVNPTGTITFDLYGPNNAACVGPPIFSSTVPVNGAGNYGSGSAPINAPGTYRWVATYSGDANYLPAATACGDPLETVSFGPAQPTIVTNATPAVTIGQPISDTATLAGGFNPTGTITFNLYGPNDPTCAGAVIFTSNVPVAGNGAYPSGPFVPTQMGTYQWTAVYSGDANNIGATSPCGAPNEASVVQPIQPSIVTMATPTVPLGQPISDTATLAGGFSPTGTITFNLYGPNDPTCAGAIIFTSTVPVAGNGNYTSNPPFVPPAAGTYQWVATYSGDANNFPATSPCGAPNEASVVDPGDADIVTSGHPDGRPSANPSPTPPRSPGRPTLPRPRARSTFTLFGPNDATCAGAADLHRRQPASVRRASHGHGHLQPVHPHHGGHLPVGGAYSGDVNYTAVTSPCNAPNEASVVTQVTPTIVHLRPPRRCRSASPSPTRPPSPCRPTPRRPRARSPSPSSAPTTPPAPARPSSPAPARRSAAGLRLHGDLRPVHPHRAGHLPVGRRPTRVTSTTPPSPAACNDANEASVVAAR